MVIISKYGEGHSILNREKSLMEILNFDIPLLIYLVRPFTGYTSMGIQPMTTSLISQMLHHQFIMLSEFYKIHFVIKKK